MRVLQKGYLKVTDGHRLYYEVCGHPQGIPVLFVHGGPGAGFSDDNKVFFNPKAYKVIFFDQRGAGRSKPFASLRANTTDHLVQDINRLLNHFHLEKVCLFGGSWGSTLSLIYAIRYPERVTGLVLRGIYPSRNKDNAHLYNGGTKLYFPEVWERFIELVPLKHRKHPEKYYLQMMKSKNKKTKEKYTYEAAFYEMSLMKLYAKPGEIEKLIKAYNYRSLAPLECHYISERCFIPENYILKNIQKIKDKPISIVQ